MLVDILPMAILATIYFVAGKLGLTLALVHPSATAVWPPTGIVLAAFLVLGYRVWPGALAGAFLVNVTTAGSPATSIGIAAGNTLEGIVGAYLVRRFASGCHVFDRPRDVIRFVALAGMVSTTLSATVGVTSLSLGGFAGWDDVGSIWFTWWLGDAAGALVVAPPLILWGANPRVQWRRGRLLEAGLLLVVLVVVGQTVFGGVLPEGANHYPLDFLCVPVLVWAAYRFGQREAAMASCVLSGIALWGTLHGFGPFAREAPNASLLLLQAFMGLTTVLALVFAALVAEGQRGQEARAHLAAIVESSDDAIIGKTLDGTILSWNGGATRTYGYTADEVIGRPIAILAPPERADEVSLILEQLKRGERIDRFETVRLRKDGTQIFVSLTISPVKDAAGRIFGAATIARDVTEQKKVEEAARRGEALRSVNRLANGAAHEINNPLTVIIGSLELLARELEPDPRWGTWLKRSVESSGQIREIVARMQHIARLEVMSSQPGVPEALDIRKSSAPPENAEGGSPRPPGRTPS